jgi:UDP-N-acetylglucosamine 2-epimerase (non-hydrolysing)
MRIVSIVGARPQFVKLAPIAWQAKEICEHLIVHTGQHYDPLLTDVFFSELNIPNPVEILISGSGTHSEQTARILIGIEKTLEKLKPDKILIYGDTNSTLAAALCASKMNITVGHVESGLRSFNQNMPEEINRIVSDHISNLLFAPTLHAMSNLDREGLADKSLLVGDLMFELLHSFDSKLINTNNNGKMRRIFCTIHRAENTDSPSRLSYIIDKLSESPLPVDLFAHPRLLARAKEFGINLSKGQIKVNEPISYLNTITSIKKYAGVVTDSGGLQKEAYFLSVPCLTVRKETEWPETLKDNWNRLDPNLNYVNENWWELTADRPIISEYGDGKTSARILDALIKY